VFSPLLFKEFAFGNMGTAEATPKDEVDDGVTYGGHAWLRRRPVDSFFPPRVCEATMLQEGVSNHCHEGVAMKTLP
jgi:hypothetical protein